MTASEEFDVTIGEFREGDNELWQRIVEAWRDMRFSTARLLAEKPSEGRLLFYVLLSDIFFFVAWSLKTLIYPTETMSDRMPLEMGYWLVIAMLMRTSCLYYFAMVLGSAARLLGGLGDWHATRAAVFWGALVAAPFGVVMSFVTIAMASFETRVPVFSEGWAILTPYAISLVPFVWFISEGVAQAHGLRRFSGVFFVVTVLCAFAALFGLILKARGVM